MYCGFPRRGGGGGGERGGVQKRNTSVPPGALLIFLSSLELMFALDSNEPRFTDRFLETIARMTAFNARPFKQILMACLWTSTVSTGHYISCLCP